MVKQCPVLLNNRAVTVFRFDDIEVQAPAIKREARFVMVKFDGAHYTVVADDYVEQPIVNEHITAKKKKAEKKTTKEEVETEAIKPTDENE